MSKINYILGGDSITVFVDGNSYTINKQAHTYGLVLNAVKANDMDALRGAVDIRKGIVDKMQKRGKGKVRIEQNEIYFEDTRVTGLIASRIFETLRVGLDVNPMVRFLENLMENPSKRAVDELFGFLDACRLPITDDGHFLAYKRVRDNYYDVHSGTMDNSVGQVLEMPRNRVDEDKNRTCSAGLHFCSYDYLSQFSGERIMILKINPRDVVAIPADYNNSKGRTCRYEVVDELPVDEYKMPTRTITEDYTDQYSGDVEDDDADYDWDESEETSWDESWEESSDDSDYELSDDTPDTPEEEYEMLKEAWGDIVEAYEEYNDSVEVLAEDYCVSEEAIDLILERHGTKAKVTASVATAVNTTGKLSPAEVKAIRRQLDNGDSLASIARQYNVSPRTIGRIRDGEAWANI